MTDPIELLARDDKWYLGCGDGVIFAPPFPVWLDMPGFWDEATIHQYAFAPLFTVTAVDEDGREIGMRCQSRRWTPAELTAEYRLANGITATEVRSVHPGGIFVSEWRFRALRPAVVHLVAWTAQDAPAVEPASVGWNGAISFVRTVRDQRDVPLALRAELACLDGATSWMAMLGEGSAPQPHWRLTPFVERWQGEELPRDVRFEGIDRDGLYYAAVHRAVRIDGEGASATFAMRLAAADPDLPVAAQPHTIASPAGTLGGASRRRWQELFARAPGFRCSDPYLETYYWYRWYGLWLNAVATGTGNHRFPAICEGTGPFHQPISVSAPGHVRELRWSRDASVARGILRTFLEHQRDDGSLHGRVYANHLVGTGFYHANWGDALLALDAVAPDDELVRAIFPRLARYAEWLCRERDAGGTGLIDIVDQSETGQGFMPRYQAAGDAADRHGSEHQPRLKGLDATVYAYALFRALERLAPRAGCPDDAASWRARAEHTRRAVRERMWDPAVGMFFDVDPRTGDRTGVKAAVCFYPYLTDIATADHLAGLERHLLDPREFWTPFPVPSSSADDPGFSAAAQWKGKRHAGPWNGRVWPTTNSHIVEALAHAAVAYAPHLRAATVQLVQRFVRMMFQDGDLRRPNSHEHYNPFSGHASVYRGIDDYQHSWVNDLIFQYVLGIRPHSSGITVDPFPFGLELAEATGVRVRGSTLGVRVEGERVTVSVDGVAREGRLGVAMEVGR